MEFPIKKKEQEPIPIIQVGTLVTRNGRPGILFVCGKVFDEGNFMSYVVIAQSPPIINPISGSSENESRVTEVVGRMSLEDLIAGFKAGKQQENQVLSQGFIDDLTQSYNIEG